MLKIGRIPQQWKLAKIVLLHKKGNKSEFDNIHMLSSSNAFFQHLEQRITGKILEYISEEQAGFRKSFAVVDYIHTLSQLIEKAREYNFPLYYCFIDS